MYTIIWMAPSVYYKLTANSIKTGKKDLPLISSKRFVESLYFVVS